MQRDFTWCSVVLRDQAEDLYCTRYDYISQHPSELGLVKDCQRNPNPNNSSNQGKTGIRIGHEDWTWGWAGHMTIGQKGLGHLSWSCDLGPYKGSHGL